MNKYKNIVNIILEYYPRLLGIYLFGSYATGGEYPDSDVDLALLFPYPETLEHDILAFSPCHEELKGETNRSVDLINLRNSPTTFQIEIIDTGRLIFCADKEKVTEFEALTLSLYQKLNEERKEILESFRESGKAYKV